MNELVNNPLVIDLVNKIGVTLEYGITEYVRYIMLLGLLNAIGALIGIVFILWLSFIGYKNIPKDEDFPVIILIVMGALPFTLIYMLAERMEYGVVRYLCPVGYMIQEVVK